MPHEKGPLEEVRDDDRNEGGTGADPVEDLDQLDEDAPLDEEGPLEEK